MPIKAEVQGKTFTFPDDTSREDMAAAIDDFFKRSDLSPVEKAKINAAQIRKKKPLIERAQEEVFGTGEVIGSIASSVVAEPASGIAALPALADSPEAAAAVQKGVQDELTFQPKSEAGQRQLQAVGGFAEGLTKVAKSPFEVFLQEGPIKEKFDKEGFGPALGELVFQTTGNAEAAAIVSGIPSAAIEAIGVKGLGKAGKADISAPGEQIKRIFRGGEEGRTAVGEAVDAFELETGQTPTLGQATGRESIQAVESTVGKIAGGGPLRDQLKKIATGAEQKLQSIADDISDIKGEEAAGRVIQKGITGDDGFISRFQSKSADLWRGVDEAIPGDLEVDISNTKGMLDNAVKGGKFADILNDPKLAEIKSIVDDVDTIDYESLKLLRSQIGRKLSSNELISDIPRADLKQLYGSISEDIKTAASLAPARKDIKITASGQKVDNPSEYDFDFPITHGTPDPNFTGVVNRGDVFDGVFGSRDGVGAPMGKKSKDIEYIPRKGRVADEGDISLDFDKSMDFLRREFPEADPDTLDLIYDFSARDKNVFDSDINPLEDFGFSELGEASWELQNIRGRIAADQGFDAIAVSDEFGTSYMVPKGSKAAIVSGVTNKGGALEAYNRANNFTRSGHKRIDDFIERVAKKVDLDKIFTAVTKGGEGSQVINSFKRSLKPEEWNAVVSNVVRKMGKATPGAETLTNTFSLERFLTDYNKLGPAKKALFSGTKKLDTYSKDLDRLAEVASRAKDASNELAGRSGTAQLATSIGAGSGIVASILSSNLGLASALVGAVGVNRGAAHLMSSPSFVKWLAKAQDKTDVDLAKHIGQLGIVVDGANDAEARALKEYIETIEGLVE